MRRILDRLRQPPHPWWRHLPQERRGSQQRIRILARRLRAWLRQRRQLIALAVGFYLVLCGLLIPLGLPSLAFVALLPLVLVPPVGGLVYWLVWKEFHS
jgi:hypothetical protein